jgi:uncharacterized damage-inducible protein DinB
MMDPGRVFLNESRRYVIEEYPTKIRACLDLLEDADLWWRPNDQSNSIGNLLLHLAGNIRQWIVSGVGGAPDTRTRQSEFDERGPLPREEVLRRFDETLADANAVFVRLSVASLGETRSIQGRETTVLHAIYHVVEHFSMHTGQIIYLTKQRTARDLGFYRDAGGLAVPEWERRIPR